jgi:hypothetical protein
LTGAVTGVTTGTANIFGPVQQFTTGISTSGITLGTTRLVQGLLRAPGGYAVRSATSSSGVNYNEIELPTIASNTTVSSASGIVNIDAGLNSKVVDYSTGIRFLGYNSGLGFGTSSTIVSGGGVGNTLTLPINTGTLALTNSVVTAFNGLTGSVTGVTTGTANIFGPLQSFTNGISASGGTFSSPVRFLSGLSATTQININTSATGASPFTITANSLLDGIGAFRINGSEPDLNLNDTDGGFNTISFENAGSARVAIGRNSSNEFYLAVRDPAVGGGAFKDNVIVANSSTGDVSMGYQLSVAGGLCAAGVSAGSYILTSSGIKALTGTTYTFLESDNGKILTFNNGSATTVTVPTGLPVGFNCTAIQLGAGQVGFTRAAGITLQSYGNQFRLIGQHASATIIEYTTNIVNISGNLIV